MSFQGFPFFDEKITNNLFDYGFLFACFFLELGPQNIQTLYTMGWFHFINF